jgi:hypothetical protein
MKTEHTHSEAIIALIKNSIAAATNSVYIDEEVFRYAEDGTLATSLEACRSWSSGAGQRWWMEISLKVLGLRMTLKLPYRTAADGFCDRTYENITSIDDVRLFLTHHRPRRPIPLDLDNPKAPVIFEHAASFRPGFRGMGAEWTDYGRPVAAINALLTRIGSPSKLDTAAGNALLSDIDDLINTLCPTVEWVDDPISETYSSERDEPYTSCMKGCDSNYFAIYDLMAAHGKLRMLGIYIGGERVGRALVWFGSNPDDSYLDRVYAPGHRCTFDPAIVREVQAFCRHEGITKTVFDQTAERFGLDKVSRFSIRVPGDRSWEDFEALPYMDSMQYLGTDGRLRNFVPSTDYVQLTCTDGSYDGGPDMVTLHDGDRVEEDDARYCRRVGDWYRLSEVVYSEYYDTHVPADDAVALWDGSVVDTDEDYVELDNGEYALSQDTDLDYNRRIFLTEDMVSLYDGSLASTNDDDVVALVSGDWAVRGHHDLIIMRDGWYVSGTEPSDEDDNDETNNDNATEETTEEA